jgi:AcrR family transcriptional regulator
MSRRDRVVRRQSRAEAAAETHELLLASAREVFIDRGYHGASIYEIAERAGRTIGSLYSHFGGKEGVFLALVDRHFEDQLARYSRELWEVENADAALAAGADFWTRFLEQDPELVVLFIEFWSYAVRDPKLRRRFAASYRKLRSELARLIETQRQLYGIEAGPSATDAAIVFDALIDGFALHRLIDPEAVPGPLLTRAVGWLAQGMISEGKAAGR